MATKRPGMIRFVQWTGDLHDIAELMPCKAFSVSNSVNKLYIYTLEGYMTADILDYIIEGVEGEFYPCKPEIFKKTYEVIG